MKKKELEKKDYVPPYCEIVKVEYEYFFCVSVTGDGQNSTGDDWDDDQDIDGGEIEL